MSDWPLSAEITAALLGAIAAGLISTIEKIFDRRRRRGAVLVAIAAEVRSICELIRHQKYAESFAELANQIRSGTWEGETFLIDIRANYFSVYEAVCSEIGLLSRRHVPYIVAFYAYCKSAIDSTRMDGPFAADISDEDKAENILSLEGTMAAILLLGDRISKFPKCGLPDLELADG